MYIENKDFKAENFNLKPLPCGEYEICTFINCNFSAFSLTGFRFSECEFIDCDFSNGGVSGSSFREVEFTNCKMLGLRFDQCDPFLLSFTFKDCILNFSSFYKLKIKKILFSGCKLEQVDFTEADISGSIFRNCDLSGAVFSRTILLKTNFTTATNFNIDPEVNQLTGAQFSINNLSGLLEKYKLRIN